MDTHTSVTRQNSVVAPTSFLRDVFALAASFLAVLLVAAVIAPKDIHFGGDFLMFITPIAAILGVLLAFGSRLPFVSGAAIAFALFLAAYGAWVLPSVQSDPFAWLFFIISTPGAGVGAVVGDQIVRARKPDHVKTIAGVGVLTTFVGLSINQMLVRILLM